MSRSSSSRSAATAGFAVIYALFALLCILPLCTAQYPNITLGGTLSLTHFQGPTAQQLTTARNIYNGLKLWHSYLPNGTMRVGNQTYNVVLDIRDDNGNNTIVDQQYASMVVDPKINFILAPAGTTLTIRARAITEAAGRLMIVAAGGGKSVYTGGSWTFQSVGSAPYYVRSIVPTMRVKGAKSIAFVYDPTGTFCADMIFGQDQFLNDQKIINAGTWVTYSTLGAVVNASDLLANLTSISAQLKTANPDVVFGCMSSGMWQEYLLRGMKANNWTPKMYVVVPEYPQYYALVDNYTSNYMTSLTVYRPEATFAHSGVNFNDSVAYAKVFKSVYGYEPESFSALGAQQGLLLQSAIQRAGSLSQSAVRDAIRLTDLETFLGRTTFNVDGSNNLQVLYIFITFSADFLFRSLCNFFIYTRPFRHFLFSSRNGRWQIYPRHSNLFSF